MTYVLHYVSADLDLDQPNLLSWSVYREEYPSLAESDGDPIATAWVTRRPTKAEAEAEARWYQATANPKVKAQPLCIRWQEPHNGEGDRIADSALWGEAWWTVGPACPTGWTVGMTWNVFNARNDDIVDQCWFDPPIVHATEQAARAWALKFESDHRKCDTAAQAVQTYEAVQTYGSFFKMKG